FVVVGYCHASCSSDLARQLNDKWLCFQHRRREFPISAASKPGSPHNTLLGRQLPVMLTSPLGLHKTLDFFTCSFSHSAASSPLSDLRITSPAGLEKDIKHLLSPRQQATTEAIVKDLIVGCSLPLSFVENGHFKHFLEIMDSKYTPVSRRTICEKWIPVLVKKVKETVLEKLDAQSSVSLTTDLWSDRRLRSFLGVTAHVCCKTKDSYALESYLLDYMHFTGRHSGERIASAFEEITEEYGIRQKISYIITDNAANMKCAFKVHMPQQQSDNSESEEENLDDEHLWEDVTSVEDTELPWSSGERLSCFAHSLQLVVNDGMKEVRAVSCTIAKHRDSLLCYVNTSKTIPAANNTRWNSTFKQVQSLTALLHISVTSLWSKDYEDMTFSPHELNQLKELCTVLAPFSKATDLTEEEKCVMISMVVPTVLDLNTHLLKVEETRMQCRPLVKTLWQSLMKRFSGIFTKINMAKERNATSIGKYFEAIQDSDTDNALVFWTKNRDRFPQLHKLALKVLTVPASSAPVERVFSRGGIIMRPHRARLGHKMLQSLMLLKCNQALL
uniref:HAT C-terminal dimerisation domain-containing protein n=1 Tax=Acanthochromis polyacanthus TaxID=80966 RepID=A0A3Q1GY77_9TELE